MPVDLMVTMNDGKKKLYHIPLRIMRGEKPQEAKGMEYIVAEDWPWTHPTYEMTIDVDSKKIKSIEIDPSRRMADVMLENNVFEMDRD